MKIKFFNLPNPLTVNHQVLLIKVSVKGSSVADTVTVGTFRK